MAKKKFTPKAKGNGGNDYIRGYNRGQGDGLQAGFVSFGYLSLLGMYNTNAELEIMSDEDFKKFFIETEKEINRIFTEEYGKDPQNVAERALHHTNELRRKFGLETI